MRIELFHDTQAEAISRLIRRNLRDVTSRDYSETFIDDRVAYFSPATLRRKSHEQHIFVAVSDGGKIVGTAALANFGADGEPDYDRVSVFVLPEWYR